MYVRPLGAMRLIRSATRFANLLGLDLNALGLIWCRNVSLSRKSCGTSAEFGVLVTFSLAQSLAVV